MEGYHIQPIHPGLAKILDVAGYKTTLDGHQVLQYGPLAGADNPYHTSGAAYYYQVFPNLMLNILPGRVQINSIMPIDADHCLTIFDFFYSETDPEKLAIKSKDDLEISDIVQQEDIQICEQVQKGLKSGAYNKGRICPSEELGVWAFHNNLRDAYRKILQGQKSIQGSSFRR
jgi:choline monooxygenase